MSSPTQTRLPGRLTVSQMAGVEEIECLIIIICRRLSTNLDENDAIRVCEYLLSGQGAPRAAADWQTRDPALIRRSAAARRSGIRQRRMDTDGGSSFTRSAVGERAMSQLGMEGF